jgi:cation diffusion facilitator CzcD-associated flavoprotein CzcO
MNPLSNVVIVGAGPYGLSIAAHLKAKKVGFRIFGTPMQSWQVHSPKGMRLKSEGFASDIFAPKNSFPISQYCAEQGIPYADIGVPISSETFVNYGLEFQRRFVPEVEDRQIVRLERVGKTFRVWLDSGECVDTGKVVLATGLGYHTTIPGPIAQLPKAVVSHSWYCDDLDRFAGRKVVVIGAGASALDCAATLLQSKATVALLSRRKVIRFQSQPSSQPRSIKERIRWPQTGLGPGWRSMFSVHVPMVFHLLPRGVRHDFARNHLGPAPGWFVRDQVVGKVPFHTEVTVEAAEMRGERVLLHARHRDGGTEVIEADHVMAATGFDVDMRRVSFLSPEILANLRMEDHKPALSVNFESSIPGLYIVGSAAASSFGPLLRFAFGARFAADRVSRHLAPLRTKERRTWLGAAPNASAIKT